MKIKDVANVMRTNSKFGKYFKWVQFGVLDNVNENLDLVAIIFCNVLKLAKELASSNNMVVVCVENTKRFP